MNSSVICLFKCSLRAPIQEDKSKTIYFQSLTSSQIDDLIFVVGKPPQTKVIYGRVNILSFFYLEWAGVGARDAAQEPTLFSLQCRESVKREVEQRCSLGERSPPTGSSSVQVHHSDASQLLLFDAMMIILIKVLIINIRMIIIRRLNVVSPEKETMVKNAWECMTKSIKKCMTYVKKVGQKKVWTKY